MQNLKRSQQNIQFCFLLHTSIKFMCIMLSAIVVAHFLSIAILKGISSSFQAESERERKQEKRNINSSMQKSTFLIHFY